MSWRNRLSLLEAKDYLLVNLQVNDLTRTVEVQRRRLSHTSTVVLRPEALRCAPRDLHTACGQSAEGHRASGAGEVLGLRMTLRVPGVGVAPGGFWWPLRPSRRQPIAIPT